MKTNIIYNANPVSCGSGYRRLRGAPFLTVFLTAAALMAGCMTPVSRQDPLLGLDAPFEASSLYPQLSLGLIESQNTKDASALLSKAAMWWCATAILGQKAFDHKQIIRDYKDDLGRAFKSVTPLNDIEDAPASGVDLVAVLDVYPALPGPTGVGKIQMEISVVFLDPNGRQVASVKGGASAQNDSNRRPAKVFKKVHLAARRNLFAELGSNRELMARAGMPLPPAYTAQAASERTPPPAAAPAAVRTYRSDADRPVYRAAEDPDRFALVVGIEKYAALPAADFAERDAVAVRDHLLALGFPQRNTILLTGQSATRTGIEKYVESWLPRNVKETSRVFIFFSGHGAPAPATGQAYLVPWDGDPKFLENTGYPLAKLYEKLNALKAKEVVVALDACFSGAGGRSVLAKGMRPLVTKVNIDGESAGKIVVLTAAGADEITGTEEAAGHGLFTYYFLKGLNEKQGKGPMKAIYDYLLPKVQDAARRENRDQVPQIFGNRQASVRLE